QTAVPASSCCQRHANFVMRCTTISPRGHDLMIMKTLGPMIASLLLVVCVAAQEPPKSQPPIWSAKPDVAAFEAAENDRLASVQRAVEQVVAVKGARAIENTLALFDEATRQLNAAYYLASTMEQVHPDPTFRDHASAM